MPGVDAVNAKGNVFAQQGLHKFAKGSAFANQVVSNPTLFKFAKGSKIGVMGEAGPEAIMPLRRGPDGRLGVAAAGGAAGGRPVSVTVNVTTPDVAGFARSQSQIAAQMRRALARGERNS